MMAVYGFVLQGARLCVCDYVMAEGRPIAVSGCSLLVPIRPSRERDRGASPHITLRSGLSQTVTGTCPTPEAVCH